MDKNLLAILVCPICKGPLDYQPTKKRLICRNERIAFPLSETGIPVLLEDEAILIDDDKK